MKRKWVPKLTTESRAIKVPVDSKVGTPLSQGADSGIGRAVALAFAREGADVAISYLSEEKDARETERLVTEAGRKAILLPGDIGDPAKSKAVAQKAIDEFGRIDILVNNAAFQRTYENFEDISEEEFVETYRVNVFAMFRLCKALLPQMEAGGSIINTGSIQSFDPSSNLIAYASTKAAIVSFTRSLASLAIKQGVRVNAVAPGPVWTPLIPSTMPKEKVKTIRLSDPCSGELLSLRSSLLFLSSWPVTKPAM